MYSSFSLAFFLNPITITVWILMVVAVIAIGRISNKLKLSETVKVTLQVLALALIILARRLLSLFGASALFPFPSITAAVLTAVLYAVRYREYRGQGMLAIMLAIGIGVGLWLAFSLLGRQSYWAFALIPALLPLLHKLEENVLLRPRQLSPTHFWSVDFEIKLSPAGDQLDIRALQHDANSKLGRSIYHKQVPSIVKKGSAQSNAQWGVNLSSSSAEITKEVTTPVTASSFVPGSTASGIASDGSYVTVSTSSQWITTFTGEYLTYTKGTDRFNIKVNWQDETGEQSASTRKSKLGDALLEKTLEAIKQKIEPLCTARNQEQKQLNAVAQEAERQAKRAAEEQKKQDEAEAINRGQQIAREEFQRLAEKAGLDQSQGSLFLNHTEDVNGKLMQLLAADRSGKGAIIASAGADVWTGSWRGAEVELGDRILKMRVDDPAYRAQHLTERRLEIRGWSNDTLQQWADRIKILSTQT